VEANGNVVKPQAVTPSTKTLPESNNINPLPAEGSKNLNNSPLPDGKGVVDLDGRKKPGVVPIPSSIETSKSPSSSAGGAPGGNRKTATPSISTTQQPGGPTTNAPAAGGGSVCAECNKSDGQPHPHGVHVKRAAMDPVTGAGGAASSSTATTPSGPPLVPSQVCYRIPYGFVLFTQNFLLLYLCSLSKCAKY